MPKIVSKVIVPEQIIPAVTKVIVPEQIIPAIVEETVIYNHDELETGRFYRFHDLPMAFGSEEFRKLVWLATNEPEPDHKALMRNSIVFAKAVGEIYRFTSFSASAGHATFVEIKGQELLEILKKYLPMNPR